MDKEQLIHDASMEILRDVGIKIRNSEAVAIYKNNGITVKDDIAFFSEGEIMRWLEKAPAIFTLYARNSEYDMELGTDKVHPSPAYGCAFMAERDGSRRPGTVQDYVNCVRLIQATPDYSICGGILVQPNDVPTETAPADMFYATLLNSDKALFVATGKKGVVEALLRAGSEFFGGERAVVEKPRMITLVNTNSPLSLDGQMLDCLMLFARYGQPVILAPSAMLGTTAPLAIAGTLASGNAENLAGIVLTQMIRPGTPVVYGMQSTAMDMRSAQYACAAPEGTILQGFGARMARFYKLPSRGGGSLTDAPLVNAQAGYESMMTLFSAYRNGINLVMEAGGVMAGVMATSYDKMLCDFEIIRMVKRCLTPFEVNEETLGLADIREVGHDGEFLTTDYTLENFREVFTPGIATRGSVDGTYFEENLDREYVRLMEDFESRRPRLDGAEKKDIRTTLQRLTGIDGGQLERVEAL